eukprot:3075433-Prymnesium_polylepis.2
MLERTLRRMMMLDRDSLSLVLTRVADDDALAASLVCVLLREAMRLILRRHPRGTFRTRPSQLMLGSTARLDWLRDIGCPWTEDACAMAAAAGRLDTLQHARACGCPFTTGRTAADAAALGGHLEVLKWMRSLGCPFGLSTCAAASLRNHVVVMQYLQSCLPDAAAGSAHAALLETMLRAALPEPPVEDVDQLLRLDLMDVSH